MPDGLGGQGLTLTSLTSIPPFTKVGGTTQTAAGGTLLTPGFNLGTGNQNDAFTMPQATGSGALYAFKNNGAFWLSVWPMGSGQISSFGAGVAYAVFPLQTVIFLDSAVNQYEFVQNFPVMFPNFSLTAFAGGGQGSATQCGYGTNTVTVCATIGDSVKLPIAVGGLSPLFVANYGAASCTIWAADSGYLNNTLNGSYALAAGKTAMFLDIGPTPHNMWSGGAFA